MLMWWFHCGGSDIDIIEDGPIITACLVVILIASIASLAWVVYVAFFR